MILKLFSIDTVIRAKVHLNFRGVNFDAKSALQQYSMEQEAKRQRFQLHTTTSKTSDEEEFDMVVDPVPKIAYAGQ